jgi:molybdopterin-guanine dinucleotide biosynthesis protein A
MMPPHVNPSRPSAVILAGGRSTRFGRDKLAEPIDGRPLLHHAIDAVRPFAAEILVVCAPSAAPALPDGVTLIHDPAEFAGPLAGLLAGLGAASASVIVVVGGDMPTLVGAVLGSMVSDLDASGADAVVLEHDGRARPLPMVLRREPGLAATSRLFEAGERRLAALSETLVTHAVPEVTWRDLDPEAATMRDIDTQADLD